MCINDTETEILSSHLTESVFFGLATDRPELDPSLDFVRLLSLTGLWNRKKIYI